MMVLESYCVFLCIWFCAGSNRKVGSDGGPAEAIASGDGGGTMRSYFLLAEWKGK